MGISHPYIAKRVAEQVQQLEHVMFAGFTHQPAVELATRLLRKCQNNSPRFSIQTMAQQL